uniref:Uncharacterized protein n=1 Tax=Triticum urartu TaxID=4572 RepID=A0A8R7P6B7_TRIUA
MSTDAYQPTSYMRPSVFWQSEVWSLKMTPQRPTHSYGWKDERIFMLICSCQSTVRLPYLYGIRILYLGI